MYAIKNMHMIFYDVDKIALALDLTKQMFSLEYSSKVKLRL